MSYYDEVEIEDLDFDKSTGIFTYACPCGDRFRISLVKSLIFEMYKLGWAEIRKRHCSLSELFFGNKNYFWSGFLMCIIKIKENL